MGDADRSGGPAGRIRRILGAGRRRASRKAPRPTGPRRGKGRVPREKPPNVIGRGPLLASPGFGVAIVCIVKDEGPYIEEWLAYHLALGVDHVFIYDNGSTDDSAAILERYQNHGLVTVVDWPLGGGQLAAYNHALRFFGAVADWLAFHDVDEFLVPLLDDDIPSMLARFPTAAVVEVARREFGYSGHRTRPEGLTIEAYTQVANVLALDPALPPRVKSIVQPRAVNAIDVHLAFAADLLPDDAPSETATESVRGVAQLNHYYTRSLEEFASKRVRGSATGRLDRPAVPFDLPTLATDTTAQRFSARTSAMLEQLRRLEPRPYTYGSQLRLDWFPRPDDLGRFAEFAIANMAAGLPEPARAPVRHLRDLHRGVGLVADLSDDDYRPAFGDLSTSVHAAALVAHMRGRIEASLAADRRRFDVATGTLDLAEAPGVPARVALEDGVAEILVELPESDTLRCWSVGWLLASDATLTLDVAVEGPADTAASADAPAPLGAHALPDAPASPGTPGPVGEPAPATEPIGVTLPASPCLAGVVEVAPRPSSADRLRVRFSGEGDEVRVYDLFAISTG